MKSIEKTTILLLLVLGGILSAMLHYEMMRKLSAHILTEEGLRIFSFTNSLVGFCYPLFIFSFHVFTLKISASLFDIKNTDRLPFYIALMLTPLSIYLFLNLWFIVDIPDNHLVELNKTGKGYIVPHLPVENSSILTYIIATLPIYGGFYYFYYVGKEKFNISLKTTLFPIMLIVAFFLLKNLLL